MSNALAIAHVTQALALLIESNLRPEIDLAVSVETRKPPADPPTEPTLTVFLYHALPSPSRRNDDLPTRASDGTLLRRPATPIDLHYVISAYGEETELVGQRLIGCVVRTLHEIPVLPADVIAEAGERPHLTGSDLADSEQRVRFTPTPMDVDETSKLWGMLHQTPYTFSVVYQASLVLIEGREQPVPARPVKTRDVRVRPIGGRDAPGRPEDGGGDESERSQADEARAGGGGAQRGTGSAPRTTAAQRGNAAKKPAVTKPAAKKSAAKKPAARRAANKAAPSKSSTAKSATSARKPTVAQARSPRRPSASDDGGEG